MSTHSSRTAIVLTVLALGAVAYAESPTAPARRPLVAEARALPTTLGSDSDQCGPDAKFIGRIELSTADVPGTWWHLTREGIDKSYPGQVLDYTAIISGWFGIAFGSEAEAVTFLVDQVRPLDDNGNNFVCAYALRGTIASVGEPYFTNYAFKVRDDKRAS
jgi:hypothetical protein